MKPRHRRILWIGAGVAVLGVAVVLVLNAFQSNLVFFFTPTQVAAKEAPQGRPFRIGGMVEAGSLVRVPNTVDVQFVVTDTVPIPPAIASAMNAWASASRPRREAKRISAWVKASCPSKPAFTAAKIRSVVS